MAAAILSPFKVYGGKVVSKGQNLYLISNATQSTQILLLTDMGCHLGVKCCTIIGLDLACCHF